MRPLFYIVLSNSAIFDAPNCSISRGRKRGKGCDSYTEFEIISESNEEHGSIKIVTGLTLFGKLIENAGKEELLLLLRMADDGLIWPQGEALGIDLRFDLFDEMVI